jgi:hypothetical protein
MGYCGLAATRGQDGLRPRRTRPLGKGRRAEPRVGNLEHRLAAQQEKELLVGGGVALVVLADSDSLRR